MKSIDQGSLSATVKLEFRKQFSAKLDKRAATFEQIIDYLADKQDKRTTTGLNILETGTARKENNWNGDGQSTLIWDWLLDLYGGMGLSVDINEDAIKTALSQCKHMNFCHGDSVFVLNQLPWAGISRLDLVYLDSFDCDTSNTLPAAMHHLMELATIWKLLPSECLIVVDDRHTDIIGKHVLVEQFMTQMGVKPFFKGYQIGWIKP